MRLADTPLAPAVASALRTLRDGSLDGPLFGGASRYVLVVTRGGWPSNEPPKVTRIISCDTDAEYFTAHAPDQSKGEKALLVDRSECGIPPSPTLGEHGGLVYQLQKRVEADLAAGRV